MKDELAKADLSDKLSHFYFTRFRKEGTGEKRTFSTSKIERIRYFQVGE
jgi:hypothetical protein